MKIECVWHAMKWLQFARSQESKAWLDILRAWMHESNHLSHDSPYHNPTICQVSIPAAKSIKLYFRQTEHQIKQEKKDKQHVKSVVSFESNSVC